MLRLLLYGCGLVLTYQTTHASTTPKNNTVNNKYLHTWWHKTGEINTESPVQDGNVRQSHLYSIQVSSASDQAYYDSFVYQTIPRNGQGNILDPNDPTSTTDASDGITIESAIGMTMSWSSFLYSEDVWVKVHRLDGFQCNKDSVVIRPTNLNYSISAEDGDYLIHVPYSSRGSKFSVEFYDNLYTFRDGCDKPSCSFVQNSTSSGSYYVEDYTSDMPVMGIEPLDSLLIFASPFEESSLVPNATADNALVVSEGRVSGLNETDATTVIFNPGVYYSTSTDYLNLSSSVEWLYFAPGAYVKGAVEFHTSSSLIKTTGHGVLSGEQYVYQADPTDGFRNHDVDASPLRMWKGTAADGQSTTWILNGPTMNSPPFNSMDWYGNIEGLSVQCTDYKQVGGFFAQTDGLEMYPGSVFRDIFYHTNDDTIKMYYSNVIADNIVVHKSSTAPIVQFGWASRNISSVVISNVSVIHSRWNSNFSNPGLIGANNLYEPSTETTSASGCNTANTYSMIEDITFANFRSEGISGPLMRIYALQNIQNMTLDNFWIEEFGEGDGYDNIGICESFMPAMTNSVGQKITVEDFYIQDFVVGDEEVDLCTASEVGRLYWDSDYATTIK